MGFGHNYAFKSAERFYEELYDEKATVKGISLKTLLLLAITLITSLICIGNILIKGYFPIGLYPVSIIFTTVVQIIMCFNPRAAKSLAIPYAVSEGLTVGVLCGLLEVVLPGEGLAIAGCALVITISVFIVGLILYSRGFIQVGRRFYAFLICASLGVCISALFISILSIITWFTSGLSLYSMFYSSPIAILVSVAMCILASMYLIASIANADTMVKYGMGKTMEWYGAYAITVNIIYLFLEVLRLILLIVSRNRD